MVGANPFREPALTAKMATTLDHISGGRAILGIGGAWFETEHEAFGIQFGSGFPERLRWLGEALPIMRGMLHGERPTAAGPRYAAKDVRNDPPPIQEHLPLLIGGGGEQVTLKLVARYGDANNVGGGIESVRRKEADPPPALRDRRARPGRDRADDRHRHGRHPRLARRGRTRPRRRSSSATANAARGRTSRSGRPRMSPSGCARSSDRLPAPDLRLPLAVRRGVDDAPRDRGPAAPRARLTRQAIGVSEARRRLAGAASRLGRVALRSRLARGHGGAPPSPGCRMSPCRTSAGGSSVMRRRRSTRRCRWRRP